MAKSVPGEIKVVANVRQARQALRALEKDTVGFSMAARRAGRALKYAFHGNLRQAKREMKDAWRALGRMGRAAMWAGGVTTAAFYGIQRAVKKAFAAYGPYMKSIAQVKRLTGLTAEQASTLVGEWKLTGVELKKGATAARFFAKNLDAARQGTNAQVETFKRLGVALKDGNGQWRDGASVLDDVRTAFSEIEDPITRSALMIKLFGRSGTDLAKWLSTSNTKMREFRDYLKDVGLVMSDQTLKDFGEFNENKRKLSLGWEAIKISAAAALVPIANAILPQLIEVIKRAARWFGEFRALVEKEGLYTAIIKMVPGARQVRDMVGAIKKRWDEVRPAIENAWGAFKNFAANLWKIVGPIATALWAAFGPLLKVIGWLSTILSKLNQIGKGGVGGYIPGSEVLPTGKGPEGIRLAPSSRGVASGGSTTGGSVPVSLTIPIYLDGREIAAYTVNLMSGQARRLARGMA